MIKYHLPGAFEHFKTYEILLKLYKREKKVFYDNIMIGSIYGAPGYAAWNGGRQCKVSYEEWPVLELMANNKIPLAFTFSNQCIEEKHLGDAKCNRLLELTESEDNYVIVNSPILEEYIREKYPKFKIISSTTKCITDKKEADQELDKYEIVCLDYNLNDDMEYLKSIKYPEKAELLVNPVCKPNCERRKRHYQSISKSILLNWEHWDSCEYEERFFCEVQKYSPKFISVEKVNKLYRMGFRNFKIEGRSHNNLDVVEILTYYLIKPEYQLYVRQKLLFGEFHNFFAQ